MENIMDQNKIYVGSLSYDTTKEDLLEHFGAFGEIKDARLIIDRETKRSKGFAFIEFSNEQAVQGALQENGKEYMGRNIKVSMVNNDKDNRTKKRRY